MNKTSFTRIYAAYSARFKEDLPFWLELARQQGGPILELGCGTGRVLLSLLQAGLTAFGLDHDADMLAVLKQVAGPQNAAYPPVLLADMGAFHLARQFALILLPCNTLSILPPTTRRAMLALVHTHLTPNGLFAASLPNPTLLSRLPRKLGTDLEDIFPHPLDGEPVQVSSTWLRHEDRFTVTWHYDHLLSDGRVERFSKQISHELLPAEKYADEFQQSGLPIEAMYGDFDRSAFTQESPNLILLARAGE